MTPVFKLSAVQLTGEKANLSAAQSHARLHTHKHTHTCTQRPGHRFKQCGCVSLWSEVYVTLICCNKGITVASLSLSVSELISVCLSFSVGLQFFLFDCFFPFLSSSVSLYRPLFLSCSIPPSLSVAALHSSKALSYSSFHPKDTQENATLIKTIWPL